MTETTMPRLGAAPANDPQDRASTLAGLVAARLCHDLVSPLGAIGNGVELLEMSGDFPGIARSPELALIAESVRAARARIRSYRIAFGHAPDGQRAAAAEIAQVMLDHTAAGRLSVTMDAQGDMPRIEARMLMLALMCLETAMPWGGRVLICRAGDCWRLVAEASRTRDEPGLWRLLAEGMPLAHAAPPAAEVHFAVLGQLAAEAGRPIGWELDATGAEITF